MKIGILGGGNMGEALVSGILGKRLVSAKNLKVSDPVLKRRRLLTNRYRISTTTDNRKLGAWSTVLILAVKPHEMQQVLGEIAPFLRRPLVISIAAGVRLSFLERFLGKRPFVRVMPNLAAAVGEAISVLAKGRFASRRHALLAERIFQSVGETVWMPESKLDLVTALSGSGPAYVAFFLNALTDGAVRLGLSRKMAQHLTQKTFQGSLAYLSEKKADPKRFIQKVASKGGTTEAALKVFHERRLSQSLRVALSRAAARSRKLSRG